MVSKKKTFVTKAATSLLCLTAFVVVVSGGIISFQWHFVSAGARGDIVMLNKYLDWGIDPNLNSTIGGVTALRPAVQNGKWMTVRMLLDRGADPNTALQAAVATGRVNIVKMLVEKGADVNAKHGYWYTPLHTALNVGNKDMIAYLRSKGARE